MLTPSSVGVCWLLPSVGGLVPSFHRRSCMVRDGGQEEFASSIRICSSNSHDCVLLLESSLSGAVWPRGEVRQAFAGGRVLGHDCLNSTRLGHRSIGPFKPSSFLSCEHTSIHPPTTPIHGVGPRTLSSLSSMLLAGVIIVVVVVVVVVVAVLLGCGGGGERYCRFSRHPLPPSWPPSFCPSVAVSSGNSSVPSPGVRPTATCPVPVSGDHEGWLKDPVVVPQCRDKWSAGQSVFHLRDANRPGGAGMEGFVPGD